MGKKILFLVEGASMEPESIKNIAEKFLKLLKEDYEICSYKTTIYELYEELHKDEDLSLVGLLKEKGILQLSKGETLKEVYSQIYLVFDFEPHYQKYSDEVIKELLSSFNNETENGKLYINYPMFEAAFYLDDFVNPSTLLSKIQTDDCTGNCFKKKVKDITCYGTKNHLDLKFNHPNNILQCVKWNYITYIQITNQPVNKEIDHLQLLDIQIELKNEEEQIYIISMFILFLVDYNQSILETIEKEIGLYDCISSPVS